MTKTLEQLDIELDAARAAMLSAVRYSSDINYIHTCLDTHRKASDAYLREKCAQLMRISPRAAAYLQQAIAEAED